MWQHFLHYCITHCSELNSTNFDAENLIDDSPINRFTGEKRLDIFIFISNGSSSFKCIESNSNLYSTEYPSLSPKILSPSPLKSSAPAFVNKNTPLCNPCTNPTSSICSSSIDNSTSSVDNINMSRSKMIEKEYSINRVVSVTFNHIYINILIYINLIKYRMIH